MIGGEIKKIIKSKRSVILLIAIFMIPFFELIVNCYDMFWDYIINPLAYPNGLSEKSINNPSMAAFLSCSSQGHIFQMIIIWLMPIYELLIYGDMMVQERKSGYLNIELTKVPKRTFYFNKILVAFFSFASVSFFTMTINYIFSLIIFKGGTSFNGIEYFASDEGGWIEYSINNPIVVYIVSIISFSIVSGLMGVICVSFSFNLKEYKYLYPIVIAIWIVLISIPWNIVYAIQPFIEYGIDTIIKSFLIMIIVSITCCCVNMYIRVKRDEI